MPDHVHAIVWLRDHATDLSPLGEVIRGWKAAASRAIRIRTPTFRWQSHYQDWIIRDQSALNRIRRYIRNNLDPAG
jgi:REP element-mobilizing transposase RayT